MKLITTKQLDELKSLVERIDKHCDKSNSIKSIKISTYNEEDDSGATMLFASIHIECWRTRSAEDEAFVMSIINCIEKAIIAAGYPCQIELNTSDNTHSATYVVSDAITAHTNQNGAPYYSRPDDEHGTVYSFSIDFEDIWTQDDEDLYGHNA